MDHLLEPRVSIERNDAALYKLIPQHQHPIVVLEKMNPPVVVSRAKRVKKSKNPPDSFIQMKSMLYQERYPDLTQQVIDGIVLMSWENLHEDYQKLYMEFNEKQPV